MLNIAWHTLRSRWGAFAGTFVALALGAALMATMGLVLTSTLSGADRGSGRYESAPVVVRIDPHLNVEMSWGIESLPLTENRGVPADVVTKVEALGSTVQDRTFYAQLAGGPSSQVGHPWSMTAFGGYRLTAGAAPSAADQVVVSAGTGAAPGDQVAVVTAAGAGRYTVSGLTAPVTFENAVFFTDAEAARLSPRVDALVTSAAPDVVRTAVGGAAQVLSGTDRTLADPQAQQDAADLVGVGTMLGMAAGVAGFVSIFVVGSTFAFSVSQRRRELALLRVSGATPKQVGQLVLVEAAVIGSAASLTGCLLGLAGGPMLAHWLAHRGIAPVWFSVRISVASVAVLAVAFLLGIGLAIIGAGAAVLRAGRIKPIEALRDAAVDRKAMTWMRWVLGCVSLLGGVGLLALAPLLPPLYWAGLAEGVAPALIVAFALLSPVVIPPLAWLATAPLARSRGAGALLVRANTVTSVRRTAATTAPVLITVGLLSSLWGTSGSLQAAKASEIYNQVSSADYVVVPHSAPGLNQAVVDRVRAVAGVDEVTTAPTTVYTVPGVDAMSGPSGSPLQPFDARTVDTAGFTSVLRLPVVSGRPADLDDHSVIVDQSWNRKVGDTVQVYLADGSQVSLRVVAVIKTSIGGSGAVLTARYSGQALPDAIYVKLRPGSSASTVLPRLQAAAGGPGSGAAAMPIAKWTTVVDAKNAEQARLALMVIAGIAVLYTAVAVANTLVMSTGQRARELALLRVTGSTPRQILAIVLAESLLVVAVGVVLAGGVVVVSLGGLWNALQQLVGHTTPVVPTAQFLAVSGACAVIASLSTVPPAWVALRTPAVRLIGSGG
ncbi:ABC transporter permease [Dactylosporangium darangshiense]|uniref:ABC transporter permease n=1 Tax=Dactylosporangium darangshiense TaxID=579108 RepID=A0ABP8DW07_9ACTN